MNSKTSDSLFDLIKSLTKSEKRYFKLCSSKHIIGEENNYVILFDYIDKQTKYNETLLFEDFKGEAFLNKFSITKKRLYNNILDSLEAYYSKTSIETQLHTLLHSFDILYKKSLYVQCNKILISAEKLALKHEKELVLMNISKKRKQLIENQGYSSLDVSIINEIHAKDEILHQDNMSYNKLWSIKSKIFLNLSQKGSSRKVEDLQLFHTLKEELKTLNVQENSSFELNYLNYHCYSAYYFGINDDLNCLDYLEKNILLFEKNKIEIKNHPNRYFSILTNAIFIAEKQNQHSKAVNWIDKLKQLSNSLQEDVNLDLKIKLFSSINSLELSQIIRKGDFTRSKPLQKKIAEGLKKYNGKIPIQRKCYLEYQLAVCYIAQNDFNTSLTWINSILNNKELDQKQDLYAFTMLLNLLVHIELKSNQLLPYAIKTTQRFFKGRNIAYPFEKTLLKYFHKLTKTNNSLDQEIIWENLSEELTSLSSDKLNAVALEYFNFKSWAVSKYKRQDYQSIITKENNLKNLTRP